MVGYVHSKDSEVTIEEGQLTSTIEYVHVRIVHLLQFG